ncbi:MAG TPA: hypothetical protein VGH20_08535 [Myxococcales bacterium]|jgi:hypothetical protein
MKSRRESGRLIARRIVAGAVTAYGLWLLAVHVFLWTPLLRKLINEHQQTVHVDYHFAWSLFPGRLHASGLVLTVQDHVQQFRLAIDDVSVNIVLGQLLGRTFHATHVRADGITFAMRRRLAPGKITQDALRGLPAIDGLPLIPKMTYDVDDRIPDERYKLFSVWLEDIDGRDVRVLWFDKLRLEGAAQVAGAFYLKPQREVFIAPGQLRIASGALHLDRREMVDGLQGDLEVRLGPLDPRDLTRERFARAASLSTNLDGHLRGLELLGGVKGGAGTAHVAVQMRKGRIAEGNLIEVELGRTSYETVKAAAVKLRIDEKHARLLFDSVSAPGATLKSARLDLAGAPPDLADLKLPESVALDLKDGRIDDAAALTARLPEALRLSSGHGTFAAHLEGPTSREEGFVNLTVEKLAIDARNETFHADLTLNAKVAAFDPQRGADLSGTKLSIANGGIKRDPAAREWWGRFLLPRAQLRFRGEETFDADLVADCRDARPIVGLYHRLGSLPGSMRKLFRMDGLHVSGSAAAGRNWLVLRQVHAEGDGAEIRAVFRRQGADEEGAAWVKVGIIPIAIGLGKQGKGLHVIGPGDFFTERQAALGRAPALPPLRAEPKGRKRRPRANPP